MADLDVTEILDDPDFADTLTCERRTQTVGANGLATVTTASFTFPAVVTQGGGDQVNRRAEGAYITGSITVHSVFPLNEGSPGQDADVVTWQGRRYTVTTVASWSNFGAGFTAAECEAIPLRG